MISLTLGRLNKKRNEPLRSGLRSLALSSRDVNTYPRPATVFTTAFAPVIRATSEP